MNPNVTPISSSREKNNESSTNTDTNTDKSQLFWDEDNLIIDFNDRVRKEHNGSRSISTTRSSSSYDVSSVDDDDNATCRRKLPHPDDESCSQMSVLTVPVDDDSASCTSSNDNNYGEERSGTCGISGTCLSRFRHRIADKESITPEENPECHCGSPPTKEVPSRPDLVLFGKDISSVSRPIQFVICAGSMFLFTVVYGCLQELIAVKLLNRQLTVFFATVQFGGYSFWSFILARTRSSDGTVTPATQGNNDQRRAPPFYVYMGLALLRATDVCMSNLSMKFLNYPAKTLIKSSRVVFTMLLGVVIGRKRVSMYDCCTVSCLVIGLGIFLHADSKSSAVFNPVGIGILSVSLMCDGAINNWSEIVMNTYNVNQDEFLFRLYSICFTGMFIVAVFQHELYTGLHFLLQTPGTMAEISHNENSAQGQEQYPLTWSSSEKVLVFFLYCTAGLFGSSCAAAITKHFGALTMSITSTARKATTLFLSFLIFRNECTFEHFVGMVVFISSLLVKSMLASGKVGQGRQMNAPKDDVLQDGTHGGELTDQRNGTQAISLLGMTRMDAFKRRRFWKTALSRAKLNFLPKDLRETEMVSLLRKRTEIKHDCDSLDV